MKLTLQLQLLPDSEQAARMKHTVEQFNAACSWLAEQAFRQGTANKIKLQQEFYYPLRERFELSAQMAAICIRHVGGTYSRDKTKVPRFRKHAAMPYDSRLMSFKGVGRVSLLTLAGRLRVPFVMGKYQRERFAQAKGQCDLVLRKDGKWFLLVTADVPDGTPTTRTDFIGVDLGVVNIATTSDGETFSGSGVEQVRERYHTRRQKLQKAAAGKKRSKKRPRNIRRALKHTKGREANFRRNENHRISKQLVCKATDTDCGLALEDLQGIRKRTRFRRAQRAKMAGWSFHQLRTFVEYKAQLAGVPVAVVDPRNTSRTCSQCHHCEKANRRSQSQFLCRSCGHTARADVNAARNIRARAQVSVPMVSEHPPAMAA